MALMCGIFQTNPHDTHTMEQVFERGYTALLLGKDDEANAAFKECGENARLPAKALSYAFQSFMAHPRTDGEVPDVVKHLANQALAYGLGAYVSPHTIFCLGWCKYMVNGDITGAVKCYRMAATATGPPAEGNGGAAEQGHAIAQCCLGVHYIKDTVCADPSGLSREAAHWFLKAAEQGHVKAQCNLANCYYNGNGVERSFVCAMYWLRKAAERGYPQAQLNLALYKIAGGETVMAVYWFRKAAEQGNPNAQFDLGVCYHKGDGVERNIVLAASWWKMAAEQGHLQAQCNLGLLYKRGDGDVEKDPAQAFYWYQRAATETNATQGNADAQFNLGVFYRNGDGVSKDNRRAVYWFQKAAEQGHLAAQYNLGLCYYNGEGVITRDVSQAVCWLRKAAEQGDTISQNTLATVHYREGHFTMAVHWFRKAATWAPTIQGDALAQNSLGMCYHQGHGVNKDMQLAVHWYRKAAEQGDARAQFNLGGCYQRGDGVIMKDTAQALVWFRKAAEKGHVDALKCIINHYYNQNHFCVKEDVILFRVGANLCDAKSQVLLGNCYKNGQTAAGVAKDMAQAVQWYRKAADQSNTPALLMLGWCYALGQGVARDAIEANKLFHKASILI